MNMYKNIYFFLETISWKGCLWRMREENGIVEGNTGDIWLYLHWSYSM